MGVQFYKANAAMKGAACNLSFNSKDQAYYIQIVKQDGWDESRKIGSFKNGEKCNLKFSLSEMGAMLQALEENKPAVMNGKEGFFHSSADYSTSIKFGPYVFVNKETGEKTQRGWGLGAFRSDKENSATKSQFAMSFSFAEMVVLREHLKFAMNHIFSAVYSADKKAFEERSAEKETPAPAVTSPKSAKSAAPKQEPASLPDDDFLA